MSTTPIQVLSKSIPIADMFAVKLYLPAPGINPNWAAVRTQYQNDHGGVQAPAFVPSLPVQPFDSPGSSAVPCFDPSNAPGYVTSVVLAGPINIPGAFTYGTRIVDPTTATFSPGPGLNLPVNPSIISSLDEANTLIPLFEAVPAFAGKVIAVAEMVTDTLPNISWNGETRRVYGITVEGVMGPDNCAQILASASQWGVGAPVKVTFAAIPGNSDTAPQLQFSYVTPVTTPPANYKTALTPLYPIPAGYQIACIGRSLFNQGGTFVLQLIPSAVPTVPEQLAQIQTEIAALTAQEQTLLALQGTGTSTS